MYVNYNNNLIVRVCRHEGCRLAGLHGTERRVLVYSSDYGTHQWVVRLANIVCSKKFVYVALPVTNRECTV